MEWVGGREREGGSVPHFFFYNLTADDISIFIFYYRIFYDNNI